MIDKFKNTNIQFSKISYLAEFYPYNLTDTLVKNNIYKDTDLINKSKVYGYDPLFIPEFHITDLYVECENIKTKEKFKVLKKKFLRWQLERINVKTIFHIISKTEANFENIFNLDKEISKDRNYNPVEWLNAYDKSTLNLGLSFIKRLRKEVPEKFYEILIESILDDETGLHKWLESDISNNFSLINKYKNWDTEICILSIGHFYPILFSRENSFTYNLRDHTGIKMYVRNYDER